MSKDNVDSKEMTEKKRYQRFCSICHNQTTAFYCCGQRTRRVNTNPTFGQIYVKVVKKQ